ncbi:unnamed protein product [Prorocentrum cordatum]|uniref:Uncharacterized protein n=1 Tax=Prorocentrum cordatum TaxID=2364126 RepID=A0ABN9W981_9DINO|nr:unnamed protein product [Polarella glacialis]
MQQLGPPPWGSLHASAAGREAPGGVLLRVKRRRSAEALPEIVAEVPDEHGAGPTKRPRTGAASTTTLRLIDSVEPDQWSFELGLPASWLQWASGGRAAPEVELPWPPGEPPPAGASLVCQNSARRAGAGAALQEVGRRLVAGGAAGAPLQLVDVEMARQAVPAPPPAFTVGGLPLLAEAVDGPPAAAASAEPPGGSDEDFLWDVYAPSDAQPEGLGGAFGRGPGARVLLAAPLQGDEDLEDLEDIDDSQSSSGAGGLCSGASSDAGPEDARGGCQWVNVLD